MPSSSQIAFHPPSPLYASASGRQFLLRGVHLVVVGVGDGADFRMAQDAVTLQGPHAPVAQPDEADAHKGEGRAAQFDCSGGVHALGFGGGIK